MEECVQLVHFCFFVVVFSDKTDRSILGTLLHVWLYQLIRFQVKIRDCMTSHRKRESTLLWKSYDLKRAENGWRREKVIVTRNLFVLSTILCYHFLCWLYSTMNKDFVIHYYYGWVDSAERRKKCHDKKFDWYPSWWQTRIKPVEPVFCQFFLHLLLLLWLTVSQWMLVCWDITYTWKVSLLFL